jgi:hypothetical protein
VFPNSYFFAVESPEKTGVIQNITLAGYKSDRRVDVRSPEVTGHASALIRFLQYKVLDVDHRYELSAYPVLTDAYAPVEYLTARVLARSLGSSLDVNGEEVAAVAAQQRRYFAEPPPVRGHDRVRDFLLAESQVLAQEVIPQRLEVPGGGNVQDAAANVIARLHEDERRRVVIAVHYAGPRASPEGTAVVLEVARALLAVSDAPRVGVDVVFLDEGGAKWFVDHLRDVYGTEAPVSAVLVDDACSAAIEVIQDPARFRDADDARGRVAEPRIGCTAADLETTATRIIRYLRGVS